MEEEEEMDGVPRDADALRPALIMVDEAVVGRLLADPALAAESGEGGRAGATGGVLVDVEAPEEDFKKGMPGRGILEGGML